jgi:hypothetical protein
MLVVVVVDLEVAVVVQERQGKVMLVVLQRLLVAVELVQLVVTLVAAHGLLVVQVAREALGLLRLLRVHQRLLPAQSQQPSLLLVQLHLVR